MRTVELAVRAAMTQIGGSLLAKLLSIQDGHSGQRVDCGCGHLGEFIAYRDKNLDTVLGRIRLRRPSDDILKLRGHTLTASRPPRQRRHGLPLEHQLRRRGLLLSDAY